MPEKITTEVISPGDEKKPGNIARILNLVLSKYFKIVAFFIVAAILLASYKFLLRPQYDSIVIDVESTIKAMEDEQNDLNLYLTRLQKYVSNYEAIGEREKTMVDQILPSVNEHDKLFTSLEAMIKGRGLLLTALDISPDAAAAGRRDATAAPIDPDIGKIKISMDVSGVNYEGLKDLLATIENNLNLMDVEKLGWQPEAESVNLEISIYYLK